MRRSLLSSRQAIPDTIWNQANRAINQNLISWQADMVKPEDGVMLFCGTRKEPDLQSLVEVLWSRGVLVGLPLTIPETQEMRFVRWQRSTILKANKWGIYEPNAELSQTLAPVKRFGT